MFNWYRASPVEVPPIDGPVVRSAFLDRPFPTLMMPVLIVWGVNDPALLPCQLDGLNEHVVDLTVSRIHAGHFSPWEAPEAVTGAIARWLEAHGTGQTAED